MPVQERHCVGLDAPDSGLLCGAPDAPGSGLLCVAPDAPDSGLLCDAPDAPDSGLLCIAPGELVTCLGSLTDCAASCDAAENEKLFLPEFA